MLSYDWLGHHRRFSSSPVASSTFTSDNIVSLDSILKCSGFSIHFLIHLHHRWYGEGSAYRNRRVSKPLRSPPSGFGDGGEASKEVRRVSYLWKQMSNKILTYSAAIDVIPKRLNVLGRNRARGVEEQAMLLNADIQVAIVKFGWMRGMHSNIVHLVRHKMTDIYLQLPRTAYSRQPGASWATPTRKSRITSSRHWGCRDSFPGTYWSYGTYYTRSWSRYPWNAVVPTTRHFSASRLHQRGSMHLLCLSSLSVFKRQRFANYSPPTVALHWWGWIGIFTKRKHTVAELGTCSVAGKDRAWAYQPRIPNGLKERNVRRALQNLPERRIWKISPQMQILCSICCGPRLLYAPRHIPRVDNTWNILLCSSHESFTNYSWKAKYDPYRKPTTFSMLDTLLSLFPLY